MANEVATQQTQTQAVDTKKSKGTLREWLEGDMFRNAVAQSLPKHMTADHFCRIAISALTRVPDLAKCEQSSFFRALMDLSALGLEPDGRLAHLIPYRNNRRGVVECQLVIDYKGLVALAMRSGDVANIHADVVCENDVFEYDKGEIVAHKIDLRKPRGEMYAAYAICTFKDGTHKAEAMSRAEIDAVRARSRANASGPWVTDYNEMAKKTVFRRLSKWLPLSPEYRATIAMDADSFDAIDIQAQATRPAPASLDEFTDLLAAAPEDVAVEPEP